MLHIVIVSFNSADVLKGLLDSLPAALEHVSPYSITVTDNNSADASVAIAMGHPLAPKVLQVGYNAGFAAAINVATAAFGEAGHLLVLNPDARLRPGSVKLMLQRLCCEGVGVVAPKMLGEDGHLALSIRREPSLLTAAGDAFLGGQLASRLGLGERIGDSGIYHRGGSIDWATGAILLVSAAAQAKIGEWDEGYFLYSEEVDYQRRVRKAGLKIEYAPEAIGVHIGGDSNVSPMLYALMTANRIRYYGRLHGRVATVLFQCIVAAGEALRYGKSETHRAGLKAAMMPRRRIAELVPSLPAAALLAGKS